MWKSLKEYIPAILRWWWVMVVFMIGDVAGIALTIKQNLNVPFWVWILVFIIGLVIAQFLAFHDLRKRRDEISHQLDNIKNARPNIILFGTENVTTPIRKVRTGEILGTPCFTQILIKNDPLTPLQAVDATNVAGHIDIYTHDGKHLFNMIGRWSETKEEAVGAQPTEMEQITIPANGRPSPMDIVLKYHEDQDCYGHTNKGRRLAPTDWRDKEKRLSVGTYCVKVHLQGNNVDTESWLNLVNKGAGTDIELQVSAIRKVLRLD